MSRQTRHTYALVTLLLGVEIGLTTARSFSAAQIPEKLLVTVLDADGTPVMGLTHEDFKLNLGDSEAQVLSVEAVESTAQVVIIFESLAATQQQTSTALNDFIASLDVDSVVDMQSVTGEIYAAIIEAVEDLHTRDAARPVVVMLGQATEIVPSQFQSSQVRGRRQAADLSGDLDRLTRLLAEHGILFYGVSVTEVSLANFRTLAYSTGGRFEAIPTSAGLNDTLTSIGKELGAQYLVSHTNNTTDGTRPRLEVTQQDFTVRAVPFNLTH